MEVKKSTERDIERIAECHLVCFSASFASKLGKATVSKSFQWFFQKPNRFMFHIENNNKIVAYCAGFFPQFVGDGSKSGMLGVGFYQAVLSIFRKPYLLFYGYLWRFGFFYLRKKFFSVKTVPNSKTNTDVNEYLNSFALSVIGVHPDYRGKKISDLLLNKIEVLAIEHKKKYLTLSVKAYNKSALKAYTRNEWQIAKETPSGFIMKKSLKVFIA